jgi:hypothetical protein
VTHFCAVDHLAQLLIGLVRLVRNLPRVDRNRNRRPAERVWCDDDAKAETQDGPIAETLLLGPASAEDDWNY